MRQTMDRSWRLEMTKEEAVKLFAELDRVAEAADEVDQVMEKMEEEVPNDILYAASHFTSTIYRDIEGLHNFLHNVHHIPVNDNCNH